MKYIHSFLFCFDQRRAEEQNKANAKAKAKKKKSDFQYKTNLMTIYTV